MQHFDRTPYTAEQVEFLEEMYPHLQGVWREIDLDGVAISKSQGRFGDVYSLCLDGFNWMNTNPIDVLDHAPILVFRGNVLLTGLGLGLGLVYCSFNPQVRSVSVIERDSRILKHVLPMIDIRHDLKVTIIPGDADAFDWDGPLFDHAFLDHHKTNIPESVVDRYRGFCYDIHEWYPVAKELEAQWR